MKVLLLLMIFSFSVHAQPTKMAGGKGPGAEVDLSLLQELDKKITTKSNILFTDCFGKSFKSQRFENVRGLYYFLVNHELIKTMNESFRNISLDYLVPSSCDQSITDDKINSCLKKSNFSDEMCMFIKNPLVFYYLQESYPDLILDSRGVNHMIEVLKPLCTEPSNKMKIDR